MCEKCFSGFGRRRFGVLAGAALGAGLVRPFRARADGVRVVMLDAGHGGFDPGAIAPDGVFEKTITLASALALRDALNARGTYQVAMTRTDDVFVALEDRVAAAVAAGADLFIALHCDHLPVADDRGASIYTLSPRASDAVAAAVASDENGADQAGGGAAGNFSARLLPILASLETRATRIASANFAADVADSFQGRVVLMPDAVRSANFAVLRDPSTPSALLEMGCLTNPLDERLLIDPEHRGAMAARLADAIDVYFQTEKAG